MQPSKCPCALGFQVKRSKFFCTSFRTCIVILSSLSSSSSVFCQSAELRLQFCRRQVFHRKFSNQGCSFTRDWIGAVASRLVLHPSLSFASEQTLKDLKTIPGAPTWRWGEWIWLTGLSELHRYSPQGLNISSIMVFWPDQRSGNPNPLLPL